MAIAFRKTPPRHGPPGGPPKVAIKVLLPRWSSSEAKSFAEVLKAVSNLLGDTAWIDVEEEEVRGRLRHLDFCLVG